MDKVLKIYKLVNGEVQPFPSSDNQAEIYSFQYDGKRMGIAPTITATIMYPICLDNLWDNNIFVEFKDERYFIDLIPSSSYSNTDTRYKHDVTFVSERRILENVYFKDTDNFSYEFHFFGDIKAVKDRLNAFFEASEMGYTCVVDDGIVTEELDIDIKNMYVNDALHYFFEIFDVPYYFIGKTLHFGYTENEISEVFEYGSDKSLLSINKDNTNDKVYTRITGVGSSENIPYYYPNFNESGNHNITFNPISMSDNFKYVNFLNLDKYINLREGGTLKFQKACKNPLSDELDEIFINESMSENVTLTYFSNSIYQSDDGYFYVNGNISFSIKIIPKHAETITLSNIIDLAFNSPSDSFYKKDYFTQDDVTISGKYWMENVGFFPVLVTEDIPYTGGSIIINTEKEDYPYHYTEINITINKDYNYRTDYWQGSYEVTCKYDSDYASDIHNAELSITNQSQSVYVHEYSKDLEIKLEGLHTLDFNINGTYYITRALAGYSNGSINTQIIAKLDQMDEWATIHPVSINVYNSNGDTIEYTLEDNQITFRNNKNKKDVFYISMNYNTTIESGVHSNTLEVVAQPQFHRSQYDYDLFINNSVKIPYKKSGIIFKDNDLIPDGGMIVFSKTIGWLEPKPTLMPYIYRNTAGKEFWYNAENEKYKDENGNYITFKNEHNPLNPKEYVAEPKEYIKPTIVGVTNSTGQRIDMFTEVAFDTNDNNTDWIPNEDGERQELSHSFFFVKLRKFDGDNGFNLFYQALETGEMTISMTSGHCGGCNFTIMVNDDGENTVQVDENGNLVRDDDGNVKFGSPQDVQQDTSTNEVWICLRKEEDSYGIIMPDSVNGLVPMAEQDTFVITNILLPNKYITDAEQKLERELIKELFSNNEDKFNFGIDFSRIYFEENNEIASLLNENSKLTIRYNGIEYPLYVTSYSYKMDSSKPLPNITVEVSENLTMRKNAIQISENRIIREVKSIIVNQEPQQTNIKGGGGGTGNVGNVNIVQTTGSSTTDVMSQKAVTNALQEISNNNVEIVQYLGDSTTKVMSQKATTDEFNNIRTVIPNVVQSTGQSTTFVMSQKAVTDAISNTERVLPFDGFVDGVEIQSQINPYPDGKIYFDKATNRFAYYREQDGIYTSLWNGYEKYATIIAGQGVIPNSNRIFIYDNSLYIWNNNMFTIPLKEI